MSLYELVAGVGVGLVGGFTSGLLGVSPGGGLVVASNLLLGAEQHVAQGISLFAQIPPTGFSGIKRYWEKGSRTPVDWLILLSVGFLFGGVAGALAADGVSGAFLRWTYVLYLVALGALLLVRRPGAKTDEAKGNFARHVHWAALLGVGLLAGFSSGFLGIGGGLAITAGLSAGLKVPQHQAQLVSLMFSIIPSTIPAELAARMVGVVVRDWRRCCRALVGNRPRRAYGQQIRCDKTAPRSHRVCLCDGNLYGVPSADVSTRRRTRYTRRRE